MGTIAHDHKVLVPIVTFVAVDVVDDFAGIKMTTQDRFHNKAVFPDTPEFVGIGMIGNIAPNVAARIARTGAARARLGMHRSLLRSGAMTPVALVGGGGLSLPEFYHGDGLNAV